MVRGCYDTWMMRGRDREGAMVEGEKERLGFFDIGVDWGRIVGSDSGE